MNLNWLSPSGMSISTRLMLWFLAISLIPCSVLTLVNNYLSVRSLERSVRSQLLSISSAKKTQLDNFIRERRGRHLGHQPDSPRPSRRPRSCRTGWRKGRSPKPPGAQREKVSCPRPSITWTPMDTPTCTSSAPTAAPVPRQVRPQPGRQPADRPAQGDGAGRGLRAVADAAPVRGVRLPGLSRPERAGRLHRAIRCSRRARSSAWWCSSSATRSSSGSSAITTGWARPARRWSAMQQGRRAVFVAPAASRPRGRFPPHGADGRRPGDGRCSAPSRASGATARRSTTAASRSWPPGRTCPSFRWGLVVKQDRRRGVRADRPAAAGERPAPGRSTVASVGAGSPGWWPGRSRGRSARPPLVAERVAAGDLTAPVDGRGRRARPGMLLHGDPQDDRATSAR